MKNRGLYKYFVLLFLLLPYCLFADVVKPALVEVSIFADKTLKVTIDLSLEAAMSGIGTQYKNTKDAPNSADYDKLRALEPAVLRERFNKFEAKFLDSFKFYVNGKNKNLALDFIKIDIVGYKKRPRKTTIIYKAKLDNLPKTIKWQYNKIYGDSAFRWQVYKQDEYNWSKWIWLRNGKPSELITIDGFKNTPPINRFVQFVFIGFDHVIPLGWDHILFIIGMALAPLMWRKLLLLVTTFTLAHTLTLGLAMLGVVEISPRIIEPLIALSISYIAIENLLANSPIKRKTFVVFIFGLIHGMGFASMLKEFEMTKDNFLTSLVGFNVGVELAQIVIIFLVVTILFTLKKLKLNYQKIAIKPASIIIGTTGLLWFFERI